MDNQDNHSIDVQTLNSALNKNYLHYDSERVYYAISSEDLEILEKGSSSILKDIWLATLSLSTPFIINFFILKSKLAEKVPWNFEMIANLVCGSSFFCICIVVFFLWLGEKGNVKKLIKTIRKRPKYTIPTNSNQ
jgi:hypothetical protein